MTALTDLHFHSTIETLKRQLQRVKDSEKLLLENSNSLGDKYTHANWGMCSREADAEFKGKYKTPSHRCALDNMPCPMRKKNQEKGQQGCYYECKLFQGPVLSQEEAISLYEALITKVENQ